MLCPCRPIWRRSVRRHRHRGSGRGARQAPWDRRDHSAGWKSRSPSVNSNRVEMNSAMLRSHGCGRHRCSRYYGSRQCLAVALAPAGTMFHVNPPTEKGPGGEWRRRGSRCPRSAPWLWACWRLRRCRGAAGFGAGLSGTISSERSASSSVSELALGSPTDDLERRVLDPPEGLVGVHVAAGADLTTGYSSRLAARMIAAVLQAQIADRVQAARSTMVVNV